MPTRAPVQLSIPQAMWPGGPLNPIDWIDSGNPMNFNQSAFMRGQPPFAAPWQKRQIRGKQTVGQGQPLYFQSRPYDRGAGAFAPKFGLIPINPIGAGVVVPYKLPVSGGPGAQYQFAAIWFDAQVIPTSLLINPTVPIETVNALMASSYVGGMYATTG